MLFDRLSEGERTLLAELRREPGFYGVLRPRGGASSGAAKGALTVKAVDRDTALLLFTLREPGPLPAYALEQFGHEAGRAVARLVADGVLEIARGDGFVSGAAARPFFANGDGDGALVEGGRIARLSHEALRY
ncbi:MAG TPA: hypothetical protein VGE98_12680, partial [Thermoanaerobaculia bacterium]